MKRLSGKDFDIMVGTALIRVESANISISDNREAVTTQGIPDGFVDGDVSGEGELEITARYFNLIIDQARSAGSFKDLPPVDILFSADTGARNEKLEVAAHECLLKISDAIDANPTGNETTKHKIPFLITGREFVTINGVPYISPSELEGLA